ncbi:MAG: type II toxin-antitoxin system MqsA family antitoxin [Gammaproteobacteria bacterium]
MDSKRKPLSKSVPPEGSSSLPSTSSSEHCASCGQAGVQCRDVTRSFGRGATLLVIEGIPMWSCPHCGESYFTAQTMHEIERIKTLRKSLAVARRVPVADFTGNVPDKALHRTRQKAPRRRANG